jgi:hypothetical protein
MPEFSEKLQPKRNFLQISLGRCTNYWQKLRIRAKLVKILVIAGFLMPVRWTAVQ